MNLRIKCVRIIPKDDELIDSEAVVRELTDRERRGMDERRIVRKGHEGYRIVGGVPVVPGEVPWQVR